jgi:hypothetical protein
VAPAVKEKHYFRLAYGVLALTFWLSVAGFTYLMTRPDHSKQGPPWSAWKPANDDLRGAREIAQRLAGRYKLDSGKQLVAIQEHPPQVQGLDLEAIGIRKTRRNGEVDPYIALYGGRRTLIYAFCGLGRNCAIQETSSEGIDRLLRREALELALYSFKYLDRVEQVVTLLPAAAGSSDTRSTAVFLRKVQFDDLLDRPLRQILPRATPPSPSQLDSGEANVVDTLTERSTYPAEFEPLPDGDAILVLQLDTGDTTGS